MRTVSNLQFKRRNIIVKSINPFCFDKLTYLFKVNLFWRIWVVQYLFSCLSFSNEYKRESKNGLTVIVQFQRIRSYSIIFYNIDTFKIKLVLSFCFWIKIHLLVLVVESDCVFQGCVALLESNRVLWLPFIQCSTII